MLNIVRAYELLRKLNIIKTYELYHHLKTHKNYELRINTDYWESVIYKRAFAHTLIQGDRAMKEKVQAVTTEVDVTKIRTEKKFEDAKTIREAIDVGEIPTATEADKLPVPPKEKVKAKKKKRDYIDPNVLEFPITN